MNKAKRAGAGIAVIVIVALLVIAATESFFVVRQ